MCKWASEAALITMLVVIGGDIFTRYLLNFSFEVADELGGYMLVVMTFVSLSVCQVNGAFHQVELIQARLTARGRALSAAIFDVLSFGFSAILLVALHPARVLVLPLRRARADLSGNPALDSAARDGDRRRGVVLRDRPHLHRPRAPFPRARAWVLSFRSSSSRCCFSAC